MSENPRSEAKPITPVGEAPELTTVHCIIAHPEKPKFLVIRHAGDHWAPPTLRLHSPASLMYKTADLNRGMMKKYRLRTTVLRILFDAKNYAVVEMELHASSRQQMQAVWVGLEEFSQFRTDVEENQDPIKKWLLEKHEGRASPKRAPWLIPGWYKQAEQWFSQKLVELGVQTTGSTQQYKGGWPTACLFRVASSSGQIYFKATYDKPPGEALITQELSELFPDHVPAPLAIDVSRNWMVMRDYRIRTENRPGLQHLSDFAQTMANIQLQSTEHMDRWRELNVIDMGIDFLTSKDGRARELYEKVFPLLQTGSNPLTDEQLQQLEGSVSRAEESARELSEFNIPETLSHLDYRPDNFYVEGGKVFITDWADLAICHPFMSICRTLDFLDRYKNHNAALEGLENLDESAKQDIRLAYLSGFEKLDSPERLKQALECAERVYFLFYFYYVANQLQIIEFETQQGSVLHFLLCSRAKYLIDEFGT